MGTDFISRSIDWIFAIEKRKVFLFLILLLAFSLRLIAGINLTVGADDMHHTLHAINFFSAGRLITYDQSAGLWHSFTSVVYNWFGISQLTSRFAPLFFGSFSVLVVYLLAREFFDERIGLLAALLLAVAPFHIKSTVGEMDVMAMFFVLLGMLFFVRAVKGSKFKGYVLSGIFIGLAIYTKVYPLLFIPSLLLYFVYFNYKRKRKLGSKENFKRVFLWLLVIFVFTVPTLTHNYLLFEDKGFLDLQFTRTTGLGKNISGDFYSWDHQFIAENDWPGLILGNSIHNQSGKPLLVVVFDGVLWGDPINSILALLGIVIILFKRREYKDYLVFFLLGLLFVLPFLASIIPLPKHFLFIHTLMIPLGALTISTVSDKLSRVFKVKYGKFIVLGIIISSLVLLGMPMKNVGTLHFYGKSHIAQMIDFKNSDIPENALIIGDSRMYRGRIHWAFNGRSYLEGNDFITVLNSAEQLPGEEREMDVYFFECVIDDCGWGTIKDQPEFNASMESLVDLFKENGELVKEIREPVEEGAYYPIASSEKVHVVNVYKLRIPLKSSMIELGLQPKSWFLYNIGYLPVEEQFDYYNTEGFLGKLLNKIAHWIALLALILAFLSLAFTFYSAYKK